MSIKRGQLKIQEMAFVLVMIMIFFGIVALIFSSISLSNLRKEAGILKENAAEKLVVKLASSPEFNFPIDCENCIDMEKALALKYNKRYTEEFWNIDYLAIEQIYPRLEGECVKGNYPNCNTTTIVGEKEGAGKISAAFVSVCKWDEGALYYKCGIGRILASGEGLNEE